MSEERGRWEFPGGVPVRDVLGPNRRNLLTLAAVVTLLVGSHLFVPHWSTRYAAYLTVFTIWMVWFVAAFVQWLRAVDF